MIDDLLAGHRTIVHAHLKPVVGSTLQPTGFPNLGAAEFTRPGQPPSLLVESVQSLTNHLENTMWDEAERRPIDAIAELPWVKVESSGGEHLTSSREEPHRLSSPYIREATVQGQPGTAWLIERLGLRDKRPLDRRAIAAAVFDLDPLCLVHGVFFSEKGFHGNPKFRRVTHAVIEAQDVSPVISGGVKRDDVAFEADKATKRSAEAGYGFIPFARTEYTAADILLSAALDLAQLRSYGLDPERTRVLGLLALLELSFLLSAPLRLRTACDLRVDDVEVASPDAATLPNADELSEALRESVARLGRDGEGPIVAVWDK